MFFPRSVLLLVAVAVAAGGLPGLSQARVVTVRNDVPRLDTNGQIVDCHSGNIVYHNGTYFLYGEHYGNSTGFATDKWPQLRVYTSTDLVTWQDQGWMLQGAPLRGTYFTPWVVYNQRTQQFVAWFNAYPNGCCAGAFGVAVSATGVNFTVVTLNETGAYADVDCNGLFVDDDGTGYVIYTSIDADHRASIEKLTDDFTHTTRQNYGLFPDHYIEGAVLFKRGGMYYVAYGSCCCFCRGGSGLVVYRSTSIQGPWQRQPTDLNCNSTTAAICGAYGERIGPAPLTVPMQAIGLSLIPTRTGTAYVLSGERWLSAPFNNPDCPDECRTCTEPDTYIKGHGYMYWIPLDFDAGGSVQPLAPFVDAFALDLV